MKKLIKKLVKKLLITELLLFTGLLIFSGVIEFLTSYFSKEAQILSSQMEKHHVSRLYFETVNNMPNVLSNVQILINFIIVFFMVYSAMRFINKLQGEIKK